ncbi:hypothetical protein QTP70_031536 [Hemibagrus guttatus]|uniref:Uncharacterized protein n=1 Tax=Hemibagrus guttatus TaxID=175788 RepID=A0AAE0RF49_9TELE|nr:hypothetical protein QTP70_031536 [Hemibagrus guttatus]
MVLITISLSAPQQKLICMAGIFRIAAYSSFYCCNYVQATQTKFKGQSVKSMNHKRQMEVTLQTKDITAPVECDLHYNQVENMKWKINKLHTFPQTQRSSCAFFKSFPKNKHINRVNIL